MEQLIEGEDFYWEDGFLVFTRKYHLQRGSCCGSGCRHCPYEPRWTKGGTEATAQPSNSTTVAECQA
ncbi:MAG: DUF5522 domain-containing protein [Blastocatellia bacterium]